MNKKAIALMSGGLDSLLAARVVKEQGIEIVGVCFVMQFASKNIEAFKEKVIETGASAGISVKCVDISLPFLEMLKNPKHGYGAHINPCIDCKIMMLRKAKEMLKEEGASFLITGEVLGERPMSQRKEALNIIKKDSCTEGILVRPLSAKILEETLPEKKGIIDRSKLYDISGRSRVPQYAIAKHYNITKFSAPAGGCLLTNEGFANKTKDLIKYDSLTLKNVNLIKIGRHFRLDDKTKVIVGKDKEDNDQLRTLAKEKDFILRVKDIPGPDTLFVGEATDDKLNIAASLAASHSKAKEQKKVEVMCFAKEKENRKILTVNSLDAVEIEKIRI